MLTPERYALVVFCAVAVALATIPAFRSAARRYHLVDAAGDDPLKIHTTPVPFAGGLGIGLGCAVALALAAVMWPEMAAPLALVAVVAAGVMAVGFADDVASVRPTVRLAAEVFAAAALAGLGIALAIFDPSSTGFGGPAGTALFVLFAVFVVVGAINAVNMQDGLDGLAGGVVAISCVGFAVVGWWRGNGLVLALALALVGALVGFLVYNFHPATVFMGDNGSYLLGFLVATMALLVTDASVGGLAGAALVVGAPVFDAAFAIVRRLRRGVSPFTGDRSHFYDYLSQRGLSTPRVALVSYGLQAAFVGAGVALLLF